MEQLIKQSFDDQVFENRNKEFGAYFLRQIYSNNVVLAFIGSVTFVSLALSAPVIYNKYFKVQEEIELVHNVELDMEKLEMEEPVEEVPPPPPIEIPPPQIATVKFLPPEVKPDEQVKKEEVPTEDDLKDATSGNENREGVSGENPVLPQDVSAPEPEPEQEEVLAYVPVQAEFPGGNEALVKFLASHISYPDEAQKKEITGDVWVQFTVNLDGSISDAKIYKGLGHGCDEEALKAVNKLPSTWVPGKVNGIPKRSKRKVKIHFGF
jgi:protein TonB